MKKAKKNDRRWRLSQFSDLPIEMIRFAKRLNLRFDKKQKVLRQMNDDEPVAWAGEDAETVDLWTVRGIETRSLAFLDSIVTLNQLIDYQVAPLPIEQMPKTILEELVLETKQKLNQDDPLVTGRFSGTIGKEDCFAGKVFLDEKFPDSAKDIDWECVHAEAQKAFDENPNLYYQAFKFIK